MKDIKKVVQEKYSYIANQSNQQNESSCCGGTSCCGDLEISMIGDEYKNIKGYNKDADLGLGCGLPTEFAGIKEGDSVLDLGSGAGNDCFVARAIVGEKGKVTGIDFTDAMLEKAQENANKLGYKNVEFVKGDIEEMPLPDNTYDVVISNCVLNLVPDKQKAFREIYRVIKTGGHFCVSDVVIFGDLPEKIKQDAEMYAGCVSGAIQKEQYLKIIEENGFVSITIHKEKEIEIPNNILLNYITLDELRELKIKKTGIYSITVTAHK
ncbi:MAG: arsenite S-adenosylmethyltransferase [Bacteroidetes bacterium GWC2_33_15]|nr:MAG: arsenite S-adenosylmethyltransferase [Bacteroidetes bacterium GWA2_33_15]OFX50429.1 MAG: arsenite S-adenosylmethyltransferase [Bacteroidetes bacterium GWC2_33_15]OFX66653.1 MAG: arsenite S-adenosylmethyltransferase [Bacteroidetes bacterium GWB2_32_14]OFX69271.1 MAG: arsenite S-adenosylmethyltransferase [Bacteroidetes bacterium GWD2_33_33]HAN18586.1 arsenite S-adenosylmethyltransferase [Bacteroidales bacterium]